MVSPRAITILFAASISLGVNAGLCVPSVTSTSAVVTPTTTQVTSTTAPPTTTSTTTQQQTITTLTERGLFRPRNARRDEGEESDMSVLSMGKGVSIEDDVEHANNGDHYILVELDRDDEEMASIEETIIDEIHMVEAATLSYSWALAEGEIFGEQGTCSIISKVDGIVVDTLEFHETPTYVYHHREIEIPAISPNPDISMDFFCSGVGFTHASILIDDVNLVGLVVKEDLRR